MTISSTTRIAGPYTSGSSFAFAFKVFAAADLDVVRFDSSTGVESVLFLTTDYTVSLNGDQNSNPGGTVTLVAGALTATQTLTITSSIANLQPTDLTNQGGFYPEVITDSLDRATIQIQQISDIGDRTVKIPISDGIGLDMTLPTASARQGKYLIFDASGQPSVSSGTGTDTALRTDLAVNTFASAGAGLVGFRQSGASATGRTVLSKLRDSVSVKDFGAAGDGVTNDVAAVQAAVNVGGTIYFPPGTYVIDSTITVGSNTNILLDDDAVIDMSSTASGSPSTAFYAAGTMGTWYSLTANAVVGATTLTVSTANSLFFAAGDWVQVSSSTVYDTGWTDAPIAEIAQVASVNTGTGVITLRTPLVGGAYNTAQSAQVRKVTFVENVIVEGGQFLGPSLATNLQTAVRFDQAINSRIHRIRARYFNGNTIRLTSCLFCVIDDVYVEDALATTTGYGVNIVDCCQDCIVANSSFLRCRHAVTNTKATGSVGINRRITYSNCRSFGTINTGDAFDTHANAEGILFSNCMSVGSAASGFNLECGSGQVIGCTVTSPATNGITLATHTTIKENEFIVDGSSTFGGSTGLSIASGSTQNSTDTLLIRVSNSSFRDALSSGIEINPAATRFISNVSVDGCYVSGASTSGAFYIDTDVRRFVVSDCNIVQTTDVAGSILQCRGTYGVINGNVVQYGVNGANGTSSSACIRITDASNVTVSNNVARMPSPAGGWGIRITGTTSNVVIGNGNNMLDCTVTGISYVQGTQYPALVIASGVVTLPHGGNGVYIIDTEGGAGTDDLDTINGGILGQQITIGQTASTKDIVVKDNTGNLRLAGDFTMNNLQDNITLYYNGGDWVEIARADIA